MALVSFFGFVGMRLSLTTVILAHLAENDPRYRSPANKKYPNRVQSHLVTFDCLTCDKCIPVCPNDANFIYPSAPERHEYPVFVVEGGIAVPRPGGAPSRPDAPRPSAGRGAGERNGSAVAHGNAVILTATLA